MSIVQKKPIRIPLAFLVVGALLFGSVYFFFLRPAQEAEAVWFDEGWQYRTPLTFTHNAADTNKKVKIDIDTSALISAKMQSDCGDSRFTDLNGKILDYFIDTAVGDCNTSSTDYYVLIPTIHNGENIIYHYYGNPSSADGTVAAQFSEATVTPSGGAPAGGTEAIGPGPALHWKMNEGYGTTANDSTQSNLDGTLNNTPTWQTEDLCINGKCLYFDGTNNESVSKADDALLDFAAADDFTIQAWVKRNGASSANNVIITKASGNLGTTYQGYKLYMDTSGDLCFATRDGTNAEDAACTSAVDFDDDKWHLVQGVKDGTTSLTLYVDGKERATDTSIASTATLANAGIFYIGIDQDAAATEWLGFIDEVKVYPYARTAVQSNADFVARGTSRGLTAAFGISADNVNAALSEGLVGYWRMNDAGIDAEGETITDSSGNSNSGTLQGDNGVGDNGSGMDCTAAGKFGTACDFDGTDDSVTVSHDDVLGFGANEDFTMAAWIKVDETLAGSDRPLLIKLENNSNYYRIYHRGTGARLAFEVNAQSPRVQTASTNPLADNEWHHIVGLRRGAVGEIYDNGELIASSAVLAAATVEAAGDLTFAAHSSTLLDGQIDEVRIYNRALSPKEVRDLYNFAPGPVAHWTLDEKVSGNGATVNDISGNANAGTTDDGANNTGMDCTGQGKFGSACEFDGTDDLVSITYDASLDPDEITIAAWVNFSSLANADAEFAGIVARNNSNDAFQILFKEDTDKLRFYVRKNVAWSFVEWSTSPTVDTWYHIVLTHSGNTITGYVDGVSVGSDTDADSIDRASSAYQLGRYNSNADTTRYFEGFIDDVRIYNYALTQKQIVNVMNGRAPNATAVGSAIGSAVAHWKFDDGEGTVAEDSHPTNNNDLTLSAASWTTSGQFDKAWNGTGAVWLSKADDADFDFAAADDLTISGWFKSDAAANPGSVEYLVNKGPTSAAGYAVYAATDGTICFGIDDDATWGPDVASCTTTDFYDNAWHQFIAVRDTTADKTYIYIDGIERDFDTDPTTATLANASTLYVGDLDGTDNGSEFNGDIDDLKFYRFALTADEVKVEYNSGSTLAFSTTVQEAADLTDGAGNPPVAHWSFNEGQDNTCTGGTNDVCDISGNGNDGAINGNASWRSAGDCHEGKCLNFDGTDDYIDAGDPSNIFDLTDMSISAWVKTSAQGRQSVVSKGNTDDYQYALEVDTVDADDKAQLTIWQSGGSNYLAALGTSTANDGNLHHLVGVVSGTTAYIYVDGVLEGTDSTPSGTRDTSGAAALQIGSRADGSNDFNGEIDDVRVYDYSLTQAQVSYLYNRGRPVGHWRLDECEGTTAYDVSGNSNDGTITPGAGSNTAAGTCTSGNSAHMWNNGATGKLNASLDFDGTDDYVDLGDIELTNNNEISFGAWVQPDIVSGRHTVVGKNGFDSSVGGYTIQQDGTGWIYDVNDTTMAGIAVADTLSAGNWYHIFATYDGSNARLYRDGVLLNTTARNGNIPDHAKALEIGRQDVASFQRHFDGQIDDVRIYNYALSAAQIRKIMQDDTAVRFGPATGQP